MESLLKFLALLSSGLFSGAALYIAAVEQPARMAAGVPVAIQEFRKSKARSGPVQIGLAATSLVAGGIAAVLSHEWSWLAGGLLIGAAIPFSIAFVRPTDRVLLDVRSLLKEDVARSLFLRWGRLHAVRASLGLGGYLVFLVRSVQG